jgi:23S rRNA pseudouridine2605 synthase
MIASGLVRVNGSVVETLGVLVGPDDEVIVNGRLISPRGLDYILLNKPRDTITTRSDERDRKTVMDLIAVDGKLPEGLFPVGRLDRDTTGVLLITNDGDLAHRLMHPSFEIAKVYVIETREPVSAKQLDSLTNGIMLEDGPVMARNAALLGGEPGNRVAVELHEGRNRIVRRMMEALGHDVLSLDRISYGGLDLSGLRRGKWRRLTEREVVRLYRAAGLKHHRSG